MDFKKSSWNKPKSWYPGISLCSYYISYPGECNGRLLQAISREYKFILKEIPMKLHMRGQRQREWTIMLDELSSFHR